MKKVTLFLFAASLLPYCVLAWNTPGEERDHVGGEGGSVKNEARQS